uniref:3CxxC-type domain-containing protein n=2 Tax=Sus scrofa TaxID=9823 RepID=A0A8D1G0A8_PIG
MDSKAQSKRMITDVETWEKTFQELIWQEKPRARWTLKMDGNLQPNSVALGWKQYQQRAFGRFHCSSCHRSWASAQVQVLCHMNLEHQKSQGQVRMRLFGQRCRRCSRSQFEKPEFSMQSTERILTNLVQRILERFYRNGIRKVSEIPVILELPLVGSHDKVNCEACVLGHCVQNLQNSVTESAKPPLFLEIGSSSPCIGDLCGQNRARNRSTEEKESPRSGRSHVHKSSGPCHATTGIQGPRAGLQPKQEMGRPLIRGADQQATHKTTPQLIRVAGSLPPGWTDPRPIQVVGPLPTGWAHSQSTLGTGPQAPRRTYSQAVRMASQQSTQEAQATKGAGLQATKVTDPQPARGTIPRATSGSDTQATGKASAPPLGSSSRPTMGEIPKDTSRSDTQATRKASAPPLGSSSRPTMGEIPKVTSGSDTQATRKASAPPLESSSQPTMGAIPKVTSGPDTQATRKASAPPLKSNSRPTQGTDPIATHESETFSGSQAAWGKQERRSPRGSAPDSFFRLSPSMPPNDPFGQEQLRWGTVCACVVALFTFLVSKYL